MYFSKKLKILMVLIFSINVYSFTISTYNIRNFDSNSPYSTDNNTLIDVIKSLDSDITVFQEIIDTASLKYLITKNLKNRKIVFSSCGGFAKQKLAISYDKRLFKLQKIIEDTDYSKAVGCNSGVRPLLKAQFKSIKKGFTFWVMAVHLKAGATQRDINFRRHQVSLLRSSVRNLRNYIVIGDFNTTKIQSSEGQYFFDFIDDHDLTSSTEQIECSSYWSGGISDGLYYPSHLDHILISKNIIKKFNSNKFSSFAHCKKSKCEISSASELGQTFQNVSDHCPIKLELQ